MSDIETDVLVLGAGIAGLTTALSARDRQACVLSPDRACDAETASDRAQGGIAAAVGDDDSWLLHLQDTLLAGQHDDRSTAAKLACRDAASTLRYLQSLGVPFAREGQDYSLHREAAHSRARVLHVDGDATGAAIMGVLRARAAEARNVEMLYGLRAISLLRDDGAVHGVAALTEANEVVNVRARSVVIATGGACGLYSRTTNPVGACGDGPAMALAAGARCDALEFVQFHPTALDVNSRPLPLLTEALRGAGARLIDDSGAGVMEGVHPAGELAPRDVVARAIYSAQNAGRKVWLDATRLADADIALAFPAAFRLCRAHGIDASCDPIPVTPAAHYHMGGIEVDLDGRASLPGLWAVGEAASTGMHGANRLASNSLLEAVVFGRRLGRALSREQRQRINRNARAVECERPPTPFEESGIGDILWRCLGLVRDERGLAEGLAAVTRLRARTPDSAVQLQSRLLLVAHMFLAAARRRRSWGAHYRSDCAADRREARDPLIRVHL